MDVSLLALRQGCSDVIYQELGQMLIRNIRKLCAVVLRDDELLDRISKFLKRMSHIRSCLGWALPHIQHGLYSVAGCP